MKLLAFFILLMTVVACGQQDCSKIDLKLLADIKLPQNVPVQATSLKDFMGELNNHVHRTHKLIMRCKTEHDFQEDNVLPGVMLWISDTWDLRNDTSKLGHIFYEHGIDPWERTRVTGILFNRYLNDRDLQIATALADARVQSEYKGRIQSVASLKKLNDVQAKTLLAKILHVDSLAKKLTMREIMLSAASREKNDVGKTIAGRYKTMASLSQLGNGIQENSSGEAEKLKDSTLAPFLKGFKELNSGDKLLLLENIRLYLLKKEDSVINVSMNQQKAAIRSPDKRAH